MVFEHVLSIIKKIGPTCNSAGNETIAEINSEDPKNNEKMILIFLFIPFALLLVYSGYYLFTNVFYVPKLNSGHAVFLGPRYYGGMNNLPSEVFRQWKELATVVPLLLATICFAYWIGIKKNVSFWKYLVLMYFSGLLVEGLFLLLTPHGFSHIAMQVKSANNGGFYGVGKIFQQCYDIIDRSNPDLIFADMGLTERVWFVFQNGCDIIIDRVRYIFQYLGANNTDLHTLSWYGNVANPDPSLPPGISHPPGIYLILAVIGFLGMLISSDLALGWGIIITILNTLLIPVIIIISKEAFSERIGKFTGIMLLTIPSVCMHFCVLFDVLLSVFTALGTLFLIYGLKHIWDDQPEGKPKYSKGLLYGLGCGTFFTLAAQGTYGHAIPILAFLLSFLFFARKDEPKRFGVLVAGILIPAIIYFVFEYYISNGRSFWPVRAWNIINDVENLAAQIRPYPAAYFANFIVIFIWGGILFLPAIIYIILSVIDIAVKTFKGKFLIYNKSHLIRKFLALSAFFMFLFLLVQPTVRLETERVLHWFLASVWPLMGIFFISANTVTEKLFPLRKKLIDGWYAPLILCYIQMFITVVLAMCIMDYY